MSDIISTWPSFLIIERANEVDQFQADGYGADTIFQNDCGKELESRIPHIPPEYDSEGNLIISEVMRYTEEGEAIWTN